MADPSRLFSFKPHFALCALSEALIHVTVFLWEKKKKKGVDLFVSLFLGVIWETAPKKRAQ